MSTDTPTSPLSLRAVRSGTKVEILYTVRNTSGEAIYLRNVLVDEYGLQGPERTLGSGLGYVLYDGDDRALFFAGTVTLPNRLGGLPAMSPRVPFARKIEEGTTFSGRIAADTPLREWHAYIEPRDHPTEPLTVTTIRLVLEYLRESNATVALPTADGVYRTNGHPFEYFVGTADLEAPCTLLKRTDPIFRPLLPK